MTHKDCGGKLTVIDSIQKQTDRALHIKRIRVCKKCGATIVSTETISKAERDVGYKHNGRL